jgi:hypothetical protein
MLSSFFNRHLDKSMEFSESLEKLKFIPGIDKIISLINRKNQKAIEKVADGFDLGEKGP